MSNILLFQLQAFCMMIFFFFFWVVHLSVRLIYDGGWSSYYICIMVTLGIRPGHLWDACTWSQWHHGFLPITPPELIFPIKNHLYLSLDLSGCSTWVRCPCTLRFYLLSQIVVWIVGDFVRGPTDYRRWLVVGCNPFSPSLSKTPLGYAHLPVDRQRGRWMPPSLPWAPSHSTPKTLLMSWDGGCKVSRIWNHRHLCLMALSPLSENCPQAWFPFCSYILARLECLPNPLA